MVWKVNNFKIGDHGLLFSIIIHSLVIMIKSRDLNFQRCVIVDMDVSN